MAWRAPTAEEESGDGGALAGRRVRVEGFGEGTVRAFSRCDARPNVPRQFRETRGSQGRGETT